MSKCCECTGFYISLANILLSTCMRIKGGGGLSQFYISVYDIILCASAHVGIMVN